MSISVVMYTVLYTSDKSGFIEIVKRIHLTKNLNLRRASQKSFKNFTMALSIRSLTFQFLFYFV